MAIRDANRGDAQNGWDTDQFPNRADEITLAMYTILQGGGLSTGGFNFDAKLRRQSIAPDGLFHAHIGGMDTLARGVEPQPRSGRQEMLENTINRSA